MTQNIKLDCGISIEPDTVLKTIFLQKGSSKEITKFNKTKFVLAEKKTENLQVFEISDNSIVKGKATSLATPFFPAAAKAVRASGEVNVKILIDEDGRCINSRSTGRTSFASRRCGESYKTVKFFPRQFWKNNLL